MGEVYLEQGRMITGKYGHRYLIRRLVQESEHFQVYELSEAGKLFLGVLHTKISVRIKSEFLDIMVDTPMKVNEFCWPVDIYTFESHNKKYFCYIVEEKQAFRPVESFVFRDL